jgi:hypothetical protein
LRAVGGEAVEVWGGIAQRCVLRGRSAVDEGDVRLGLGVILDREAFVAGERSNQDRHAVLLDQLARRLDRAVGRRVGGALDDLDLLAAGLVTGFGQRQFGAANAVLAEHRERPFQSGEQADLDRVLGERHLWRQSHAAQQRRDKQLHLVTLHHFLR